MFGEDDEIAVKEERSADCGCEGILKGYFERQRNERE